jgi:pimeloyl-ACP methyl ester carboxylesterase
MPEASRIVVRDTPVDLLRGGAGPPLLFLHGAGAGGHWLAFQERLAGHFGVLAPSHPGHGGSPAAEWIEHISDLAFHYLDLLDTLGLARVHAVGASFGGWIAAEMATMASSRLDSLTLIDPVGIKVEGCSLKRLLGSRGKMPTELTYEDLEEGGYIICGSPATVRDKLRVFSDELRAGIVCSGMNGGSHDKTLEMMQLFAEKVMPHFREDARVDETAGVGR